MGSLIGGAVGSMIAGPLGGIIGSAAGSYLDNMILNHRHVNPPSIWDLTVEASTMGVPIPPVYGRARLAGNLIMSTPLIATKQNSKGKGGSSGGKGQTFYTYAVTCAVAVCRGPITNIWRMYADSKLIWDMDPQDALNPEGTPVVMSAFLPTSQAGGVATIYSYGTGKDSHTQSAIASAYFYYGTEDQEPDPNMQAIAEQATGISNSCPAYRGIAYVVLVNFPLAYFGNRIPNFSFEVNGWYSGASTITTSNNSTNYSVEEGEALYDPIQNYMWYINNGEVETFNALSSQYIYQENLNDNGLVETVNENPSGTSLLSSTSTLSPFQIAPNGTLWTTFTCKTKNSSDFGGDSGGILVNIDPEEGVQGAFPMSINTGPSFSAPFIAQVPSVGVSAPSTSQLLSPGQCAYLGSSNLLLVCDSYAFSGKFQIYLMLGGSPQLVYYGDTGGNAITSVAWADDQQIAIILDGRNEVFWAIDIGLLSTEAGEALTGQNLDAALHGPYSLADLTADDPIGPGAPDGPYYTNYDITNQTFLFFGTNYSYSVQGILSGDVDPNLVATLDIVGTFGGQAQDPQDFMVSQNLQGYIAINVGTNVYFVATNNYSSTGLSALDFSTASPVIQNGYPRFYVPFAEGAVAFSLGDSALGAGVFWEVGQGVPLSQVVYDICTESGIPGALVDTSALTDIIPGYAITSQASGRSALEPLQSTYLFDLVESNGKLVARYRLESLNNPVTIDAGDLGARSEKGDPGAEPEPRLTEVYTQDYDLPQYVFFRYKTASGNLYVSDFCFETGCQYAQRAVNTTGSTAHLMLTVPMCLYDEDAAQLAAKILYLQYAQRTKISGSLPLRYLGIEGGDCLDLTFTDTEGNTVTYQTYIQQVDIGADNTIKFSGVSSAPSAFTSTTPGASPILVATGLQQGSPTFFDIMETPPLQDSDDSLGFYFGAAPRTSAGTWGYTLEQSIDGGQTFAAILSGTQAAGIGKAQTALGSAGAVGGCWDTENTVTISVMGGVTLESVTTDQVLGHANIFLLGGELVGAANVTQVKAGVYTLSLLLRGLCGTDINMGSHVAGEVAAYMTLNGSIQDETMAIGALGLPYIYAAVSFGADLSAATRETYAMEGTRIRPEAVVHQTLVRDASGNATISWNPRNRINYEWLDGTEQGVDEAVEGYSVDILDTQGAVVRTLTDWLVAQATVGETANADTGIRAVQYSLTTQEADGLVPAGAEWDADNNGGLTLTSSGGLYTATNTVPAAKAVRGLAGASADQYYFEINPNLLSNNTGMGLADATFPLSGGTMGDDIHSVGPRAVGGIFLNNTDQISGAFHFRTNNINGVAVNLATLLIWFYDPITGLWNGSATADPSTGVGGIDISSMTPPLYPVFAAQDAGEYAIANFGGAAFSNTVPSGFGAGWPGPGFPLVTANIYETSSRVGRGFVRQITG